MKHFRIYLIIMVVCALLFGWAAWSVYRTFKAAMEPSVCVCTVSPSASDEAAQALIRLIEQSTLEKKDSLASVAHTVQKEFPCCTFMSCRKQPSGLVQARIEFDDLLCAVNDDALVTAHGVVVSRIVYADQELIDLPQLRMPTVQIGESLTPHLLGFLRHIPENFFLTHEVVSHADDTLALVSREPQKKILSQEDIVSHNTLQHAIAKDESNRSVQVAALQPIYLCDMNTLIDDDLLNRCDSVLADYEQQKATSKKKARTALVLDVRFDKQIILYPHMGGQIHG